NPWDFAASCDLPAPCRQAGARPPLMLVLQGCSGIPWVADVAAPRRLRPPRETGSNPLRRTERSAPMAVARVCPRAMAPIIFSAPALLQCLDDGVAHLPGAETLGARLEDVRRPVPLAQGSADGALHAVGQVGPIAGMAQHHGHRQDGAQRIGEVLAGNIG